MGEAVTDDNFHSIILGSLPQSYDLFLTAITNQTNPIPFVVKAEPLTIGGITLPAQDITVTPPKISPDDLIETLGQEADCWALKAGNPKDGKDIAFSASPSGGQKGGKKKKKSGPECWKCHKLGHIS